MYTVKMKMKGKLSKHVENKRKANVHKYLFAINVDRSPLA